jgi:hypothetical protein
LKREFKFRPFVSNLFLVIGLIFILGAGFFYFFKPMGIDVSFWLLIVSIIFIIFGMYRILTFYAYIGEYALSLNTSLLRPKNTIPWREISDIEMEDKGIIIVYRAGGRAKNLFINRNNIEKNQWDTFVDNIIEQWKESAKNT